MDDDLSALEGKYDLVIAGSGAAGLASAIIAHSVGLRPIIVEKTDLIGGTSCYSGGVIWVPNSRQNVASGVEDSVERAERYLDSVIDNPHEREARRQYLERGAEAVAYLEQETGPLFYVREINSPDYYPEADGAVSEGRAMTPVTFDGRKLGKHFRDLRAPLPEFTLFGRQMLELMDVYHLLNARRSLKSAFHAGKLFLRDARDRLIYRGYGRGTRLTGGNALVGQLYLSSLERAIPVLRNAPLVGLIKDEQDVRGVEIAHRGERKTIRAEKGVILATGGFPWSEDLRHQYIEQVPAGFSATSRESTGDGIAVAIRNGAQFDRKNSEGAFWAPVSFMKRADGSIARFPHLMADRAKPGLIAVSKLGQRFCNEADNYHDFVISMTSGLGNGDHQPVHLLCDADFVRQYAFGAVPPLASDRRRAIRSGYLIEASSIADLAAKTGVDPDALGATVTRNNEDAKQGVDSQFGKGSSAYNRYLGDPAQSPNPCLGAMAKPPYYAIRVHPGDIGTTMGLAANVHSQVLDAQDEPIPGLYACGNDRNSIMAGLYPSGGITIGPALVFAYLAVMHAAIKSEAGAAESVNI